MIRSKNIFSSDDVDCSTGTTVELWFDDEDGEYVVTTQYFIGRHTSEPCERYRGEYDVAVAVFDEFAS